MPMRITVIPHAVNILVPANTFTAITAITALTEDTANSQIGSKV